MKLTCPACGSLSSLDALIGNEGARDAVMAALAIPESAKAELKKLNLKPRETNAGDRYE